MGNEPESPGKLKIGTRYHTVGVKSWLLKSAAINSEMVRGASGGKFVGNPMGVPLGKAGGEGVEAVEPPCMDEMLLCRDPKY